jgi:hypothetical protein
MFCQAIEADIGFAPRNRLILTLEMQDGRGLRNYRGYGVELYLDVRGIVYCQVYCHMWHVMTYGVERFHRIELVCKSQVLGPYSSRMEFWSMLAPQQ